MPLSIDSARSSVFDYSTANVNKTNTSRDVTEEVKKEVLVKSDNEQRPIHELPKEEVEAIFLNRQDSELNKVILNTFASQQNKEEKSQEFSFDNIDTFSKKIEESESLEDESSG